MEEIDSYLKGIWGYLTGPELWIMLGERFVKILIILILAFIVIRMGRKIIDRLFVNKQRGPFRISERREETLNKLIKNILTYVVYFMAIAMILDTLTIRVGPLL